MSEPLEPTQPTAALSRATKVERRLGQLTVRVLDGSGAELTIRKPVARGGRSRAADIVLEHPSVSGMHFELRASASGIELLDLDSRNGTWLGGRRVFHVQLQAGDVFAAGECRIELIGAGDVDVSISESERFGELHGRSRVMRELFAELERLAPTPVDVLVLGETGTGKELVARALHRHSRCASGPFRVLDCGSLPPSLAEAAIFGHRRGAFTGAEHDQPGVFEEADSGTLFLDEIGELPLELQVKLLRVLDRREVARVGEPTKLRQVDVRVVAATHRDLRRMVAEGHFREDLYFRLARATVEVPPLRERGDDIELLARDFLARLAHEHELARELADEVPPVLRSYRWPGNVRELKNVIEHAAFVVRGSVIHARDLALSTESRSVAKVAELARVDDYWRAHEELDRLLLTRILSDCEGNLSEAARRIKVSRPKLRKRLRELGLYAPGED